MSRTNVKEDVMANSFANAIQQIKQHPSMRKEERIETEEIVDIIKFCEDPKYLNLPAVGLSLWDAQRIILKCFYIGSIGNKELALTQAEWEWLYKMEPDEERDGNVYQKNIKDVIRKMQKRLQDPNMPYFKELHLQLGRRASKTTVSSIITAYEAYKLLVINEGDPHGYYNLPQDNEIAIINCATALKQAEKLYGELQARIRNSPFFRGRIAKETSNEIRLYTNRDLAKKAAGATLEIHGSILLLCAHSNADSLAGINAILILFDEIAFYDETGKYTGKYFYGRLKPALSKFYKYDAARIVQISSPNKRLGIFYETAMLAKEDDANGNSILSFQLPTWDVNPDVPYDHPEMTRDRVNNLDLFNVEFGAQWAEGGSFSSYFDPGLIDRCVRGDIGPHRRPVPGFNYYIHIDPAKKSANYAIVMVAKKRYTNNRGMKRNLCYLAGVWAFKPQPGIGLLFHEIDKTVIRICSIFHPLAVTYDDYHSMQSIQLLNSHGINTRIISYNRSNKAKFYQNLSDLMSYQPTPELFLYNDGGDSALLIAELKALKKKQTQRGYAIVPDKNGDVKTDDLSDSLAGACASACEALRMALPEPVTVYTGMR